VNRQCYLTFILWPETWLYIYTQNFETRCLKSDARKYFPSLCNYPIAQRCRPFARHDWHVCIISHWLRTRETSKPLRSIWCCSNDLSKSSPVLFFGELGACLKTWLDQRILDSKTSSFRLKDQYPMICEIADQLNKCCAENEICPAPKKSPEFYQ